MTQTLLKLDGIYKSFDTNPVLENIDLELQAGEILFLLGASGCGKTTLLRLIAGFEKANQGRMQINNRIIFDRDRFIPPKDRHLGYVLQEGVLFPHLSVYRNIAYGLGNGKGRTTRERQRIQEVMELTNISELAHRMPHEISGGQQQRVALARALAPNPTLMLLDEPFSALDEHLRSQIRSDVIDILRRSQSAAIIVTHDRHEALSCADKVGLLHNGRLVQMDTPKNIYRHPKTPEIARFISDNGLLLDAQLHQKECCASSQLAHRIPVDIASPEPNMAGQRHDGQLFIRADQLVPTTHDNEEALFKADVEHITFHGSHSQANMQAEGIPINLAFNNDMIDLQAGHRIGLKMLGKGIFYPYRDD